MKHNAANERIKRAYLVYLREAKRRSDASIDGVARALCRFEEATDFRDFGRFHREQAVSFKRKLDVQTNARNGQRLSRATVHSTLSALRGFFIWLADQPGYKRRISYSDADYFNLSDRDVRIATATNEKRVPDLAQIHHVLSVIPTESDIQKRDRAMIALTLLTGVRDGALPSLKLRHLDLERGLLIQDPREVNTKFAKTIMTTFFPVGGDARAIVEDWASYLRNELLWSQSDPLFPATLVALGSDGAFAAQGLRRAHWHSGEPVRRVFREAFEAAGLPYFNPHSFRDALARLGERACRNAEELKAWSQNLGHENVLTTLTSYGAVPAHRQAELIATMENRSERDTPATVETVMRRLEAALAISRAKDFVATEDA